MIANTIKADAMMMATSRFDMESGQMYVKCYRLNTTIKNAVPFVQTFLCMIV